MIGTNAYEGGSFGALADSIAKADAARWGQVEAVYDGYGTHKPEMIKGEFATDAFMTEPARALARAAAANGQPTYLYQFSYLRPSQRDGKIPGPLHFDEVYVVFDSMTTSQPPVSDDKAAVEAMESRWTSFARTGVPSGDWPRFQPGDEAVLDFTDNGPVPRKDFKRAKLDVAEALAEPAK